MRFIVDDHGVLSIFHGDSSSVILPRGIIAVGEMTFMTRIHLQSIAMSPDIKNIEYMAFFGCYNLTSVLFVEGLECLSSNAFRNCKNLKSVKLPNSLRVIGQSAFEGCSQLKAISLPPQFIGIEHIKERFFKDCDAELDIQFHPLYFPDLRIRKDSQGQDDYAKTPAIDAPYLTPIEVRATRCFLYFIMCCGRRTRNIANGITTGLLQLPALPDELWIMIANKVCYNMISEIAHVREADVAHGELARALMPASDEDMSERSALWDDKYMNTLSLWNDQFPEKYSESLKSHQRPG